MAAASPIRAPTPHPSIHSRCPKINFSSSRVAPNITGG